MKKLRMKRRERRRRRDCLLLSSKLDESTALDTSDQIKDDSYSFSSDVFSDNGVGVVRDVFKGKVDTPGTNVAALLEADLMVTTPRRGVIQ